MKPKFKIGDKVRISKIGHSKAGRDNCYADIQPKGIGTVTEYDKSSFWTYAVDFGLNVHCWYLKEEDMEYAENALQRLKKRLCKVKESKHETQIK